jgi:hypothetical protein
MYGLTQCLGRAGQGSVGHRRGQREIKKKEVIKTKVKVLVDMSHEDHVNYV